MAYDHYNEHEKVCIRGRNENKSFQIFLISLVVVRSIRYQMHTWPPEGKATAHTRTQIIIVHMYV